MSEENEIKRMGGKAQHNSGRGWREKGDATWKNFLVDVKETKKSFGLTRSVWGKVCTDTFRISRQKNPALCVVIGEGNDKIRLAVVEWDVLAELVEFKEQHENN